MPASAVKLKPVFTESRAPDSEVKIPNGDLRVALYRLMNDIYKDSLRPEVKLVRNNLGQLSNDSLLLILDSVLQDIEPPKRRGWTITKFEVYLASIISNEEIRKKIINHMRANFSENGTRLKNTPQLTERNIA